MSGPIGVSGFEEGEFEGDSPTKEVAAEIRLQRADPVQLGAQEIDEDTKIRIVVERDPLGVHEVVRGWLWGAGSPIRNRATRSRREPFRGIAARFRGLAHDPLEAGACLRIGVGHAPVFVDAERFERAEEVGVLLARHHPDEAA